MVRWPHAVRPLVLCHSRLNATHCLDRFSYENNNTELVVIERALRWNSFWPAPADRAQPQEFWPTRPDETPANTFDQIYACGGSVNAHRRRLIWLLRTDHPLESRTYRVTADSRIHLPCD